MKKFLNADEVGVYSHNGSDLTLLRSGNSTASGKVIYPLKGHFEEISSICNNTFNATDEFVRCATELAEKQVKRQYVTERKEYVKAGMPVADDSILEFSDKSKTGSMLTGCASLFTLMNRGEMHIEDSLYLEEKLKKASEGLRKLKKLRKELGKYEDERDISVLSFVSKVGESAKEEVIARKIDLEKNTKFKIIRSLNYSRHKEEPKIDKSKYAGWRICDFEKQELSSIGLLGGVIPFQQVEDFFVGVFKEENNESKYEIKFGKSEPVFKNANKWIDSAMLKEFLEATGGRKVVEGCNNFISEFLEKSGVKVEGVYLNGKIIPHVAETENGKVENRLTLEPQDSFVTLSNELEKRTVEAPFHWALGFGLEKSSVLNVRKESAGQKDLHLTYVS